MILYILDMNKQKHFKRTFFVYILLSIIAIIIDNVYSLFGHGIRSNAMTYMFLYPLLGGAIVFGILGKLFPDVLQFKSYRFAYNIYNAGIATVTIASFLVGIMEIAGTASNYNNIMFLLGFSLVVLGLIVMIKLIISSKRR